EAAEVELDEARNRERGREDDVLLRRARRRPEDLGARARARLRAGLREEVHAELLADEPLAVRVDEVEHADAGVELGRRESVAEVVHLILGRRVSLEARPARLAEVGDRDAAYERPGLVGVERVLDDEP